MTRQRSARPWVAFLAICATAVAILVALPATVAPTPSAEAVTAADWRPGNIIDDATFYNSNSMSSGEVQAFMESQLRTCRAGFTCLKDYRQNTENRSADRYCDGYSGRTNESASTILDRVARSCGVSQKVLLVLLQKEQGLLTDSAPTATKYAKAMGQGCPDTAGCNQATAGYFFQVYYAARQYEIYRLNPTSFAYQADRWNNILLHPYNTSCGTQRVFIQNQATAGLYIYTPYVPNASALNNMYGTGDSCASYGNRNFWRLFSDWFGTTSGPSGTAAIESAYQRYGGAGGSLGAATGNVTCGLAEGGCYRDFQNGQIHWTPATGAYKTSGAIGNTWRNAGSENSSLGYPRSDELCVLVGGGCYQEFQDGQMHWTSATGAQPTIGAILDEWKSLSSEQGVLGYPLSAEQCVLADGGCYQEFQGGQIHYSAASGAHATRAPFLAYWQSRGSERSVLRYPTSDQKCGLKEQGCYQNYQGGLVHSTPSTGIHATVGETLGAWARANYEHGALGYPTTDDRCGLTQGGCRQDFQGGRIYWLSGISAQSIYGPILDRWVASGGEGGPLGYPTSSTQCVLANGGCYQEFQNGQIHFSPTTGAKVTSGATLVLWRSLGSEKSTLGYPTSDQRCGLKDGGCYQDFQNGQIHWSPGTGARASSGAILTYWQSMKSEKSSLGYPTSSLKCGLDAGGCYQDFQGGLVHWTPTTGAHATQGAILRAWAAANYEHGRYGYPIADQTCTSAGACSQRFQGGTLP
ncbi:hypothetical protein ACFXQA_07115 [Microbacterium sp. P07]|uniref:hypothetical protein n=1 Tax=Microbacterium sp. P07 TaxID=3366952 RepID=UPI0037471835